MIALEQLLDGSMSQRNFETIAALSIGTGGKGVEIRFGSSALTFTASVNSAGVTVSHGLGRTPVALFTQAYNAPAAQQRPTIAPGSIGATTFAAGGEIDVAYTGTIPFYWLAIG